MRSAWFLIFFICAILNLPRALSAQDNEEKHEQEEIARLCAEVATLQQRLEKAEARLSALEEVKEESGSGSAGDADHFQSQGPDGAALAKIILPAHPDHDQAAEYVKRILNASKHQNTFSEQDPQVSMLAAVGPQHLDVLLETADQHDFYIPAAVAQIATEAQKKMVVDAMDRHRDLVEVIVRKGWSADARQVLLNGLQGEPSYLPTQWIDAVAALWDPATYPLLTNYLIHGLNPFSTYQSIADLPGIELEKPVKAAWARQKGGSFGMGPDVSFARVAAGFGEVDAMEWIGRRLAAPGLSPWDRKEARDAFLALTDASGSDKEIIQWFKRNRGRLRWDSSQKKFAVTSQTSPSTTAPAG